MTLKNNMTLLIFLIVLSVNWIFFSGHIGGDALWNYFSVESIFKDGNFDLSDSVNEIKAGALSGPFEVIATEIERLSLQQGLVYSKFGLAQILIGATFYGLGLIIISIFPFLPHDYVLVYFFSLQNVILVALISCIFFMVLKVLSLNNKGALFLTLCLSFSTIFFTYAVKSGFGEPLAALSILLCFYYLLQYDKVKKTSLLIFAGFFTGFLLLTKIYTLLVYPGILVLLLLVISHDKNFNYIVRRLLNFSLGFFVPVCIFFIFNYIRFDNIFQTGYSVRGSEGTISTELVPQFIYGVISLYKILLSPGKGVLIFNPIILLSFIALKKMYILNKKTFYFYVTTLIPYLIFFSFSSHWASYGAWGARYFIPVIPIMIIPVIFLFDQKENNFKLKSNKLLCFLFFSGVLIQLPSIIMNYSAFERFSLQENQYGYYTRIDMPHNSPIIGGYYLLFSGINRTITGESLKYPVIVYDDEYSEINFDTISQEFLQFRTGIIFWKSLAGFDWFDLWIVHLIKEPSVPVLVKLITLVVFGTLMIAVYTICWNITH